MAKWPHVLPVAPNLISAYIELAPVVELERLVLAPVGNTATFAGRQMKFLHGVLKDQPGTQWIYDPAEKVLFTADAFGYFHEEGDCDKLGHEMEDGSQ
jgi:flavorubredoxin